MNPEISAKYRNIAIFAISIGAIFYYLPYFSREFMGDDWLWLYNAKRALTNPIVYFQRPMYGYLRPLNMIIVSIWYSFFGVHSWIFSLINILLHGLNVFLMYKLLRQLKAPDPFILGTCFFFAFYYLACPAIEWISVGHDLWVTALTFIFIMGMLRFFEKPAWGIFFLCFISGFSATLIKESGFITLGFYYFIFIINKANPFSKKFLPYTASITIPYLVFLIVYMATRTIADKEVLLGLNLLTNTWYFLAFTAFPLSQRILNLLPASWLVLFKVLRIISIIIVPIAVILVFVRGKREMRFFILWSIMAISTIAIFNWHLNLFDLVPESTASRFMYYALPGLAAIFGWIINKIGILNPGSGIRITAAILLSVFFLSVNQFVINKVSQEYFTSQNISKNCIIDFKEMKSEYPAQSHFTIVLDSIPSNPSVNQSPKHLAAIANVKFGLNWIFRAATEDSLKINPEKYKSDNLLKWDNSVMRFRKYIP